MKLYPIFFVFFMCTQFSASKERPNIVFIFSDDHGEQAISAYGSKLIQTPNLDRIAKGGVLFTRCYVTNSICAPSRAVIQTGKYNHKNGQYNNKGIFDGSQQTFPKLLKQSGYQTAIIGKWHLKSTPQGFDHYEVLLGQGPYYNPTTKIGGDEKKPVNRENPSTYTTEAITSKAIDWLKNERKDGQPFMLMVQHKAPHRNWQPAPKYLNWLDDVTLPEPETLFDDYQNRGKPARVQNMEIAKHMRASDLKLSEPSSNINNMTPAQTNIAQKAYESKNKAFVESQDHMTDREILSWKYQRYVKDYLRCIRSVDDSVGEVLDYLTESGLADNTVVIYSSDQGWYLGEHGWFDKRWMYEESLKTPLLIKWPGISKPGEVNDMIVSNLDFAQTFLDIAGLSNPEEMQGKSLTPLLRGEEPNDWRSSFYYHYYETPGPHNVARHYGVTDGRYKLIHYYFMRDDPQLDEWELFDLQNDPHEINNVHNSIEFKNVQQRLVEELKRLQRQYEVPKTDFDGVPIKLSF